jgi:type IV secretory pathway VirB10-like protein
MSQPTPGVDTPTDDAAALPFPSPAGDGTPAPTTGQFGDPHPGQSEERAQTAVFPAAEYPAAATPEAPVQPRRRNRLHVALTVAIVVLLAVNGVLTALLIGARSAAADLAAEEAAEDRERGRMLGAIEEERGAFEERISAAQADIAAGEDRIAVAEAEQQAAREAAAAREQAATEAAAADEQTFLEAMDATETMSSISDAELLARGRDVCTYLDSTAGTLADVSDAFDRAAETYAFDEAILLVTAATGILCPEYGS